MFCGVRFAFEFGGLCLLVCCVFVFVVVWALILWECTVWCGLVTMLVFV